ncbi:hypothetical protein U8527_00100 [Kordia algicida OT-1]|uniref:Uncharacterized protein n=1 Tax=Kordia algicida OT-1 TaxID=391587 RepID=A9DQS3_9FLAO|nr:hypothetical protein [Kordia algicida]EDP96688.1 hypothetical protein KAOT1_16033 [Kordia algicida OT-1]
MKKRSLKQIEIENKLSIVSQITQIKGGSMSGMTSETEIVEFEEG